MAKRELPKIDIPKEIKNADVLFVSHSGGKDSQALLAAMIRLGFKDKIVLIHSDLGYLMEWEPMEEWIKKNSFGLKLHIIHPPETFFDVVRRTEFMPSANYPICTDNLKLKPIEAFIHDYMERHKLKVGVNVTGIRGVESDRRAKKPVFGISDFYKVRDYSHQMIYDWNPIKHYLVEDVLAEIEAVGQKIHKVYSFGYSRLSCTFCVNSQVGEHTMSVRMKPETARAMAEVERDVNKTIRTQTIKGKKVRSYTDERYDIHPTAKNKDISNISHETIAWDKIDDGTYEIDMGEHIIKVIPENGKFTLAIFFFKDRKKYEIMATEILDTLEQALKFGEKTGLRILEKNIGHLITQEHAKIEMKRKQREKLEKEAREMGITVEELEALKKKNKKKKSCSDEDEDGECDV